MSKLADYNTPEARVSLFAEELKAIYMDGNTITPDLIDIVGSQYLDMSTINVCIDTGSIKIFKRDFDKACKIVDSMEGDITKSVLTKKFDEAGIDYILDSM